MLHKGNCTQIRADLKCLSRQNEFGSEKSPFVVAESTRRRLKNKTDYGEQLGLNLNSIEINSLQSKLLQLKCCTSSASAKYGCSKATEERPAPPWFRWNLSVLLLDGTQ